MQLAERVAYSYNSRMSTTERTLFSPEVRAELEEAINRLLSGARDPDAVRKACERMDRMREEIQQRHGVLEIGVPAIRELRGELPSP